MKKAELIVHTCCTLLGMCSLITLSGLWVELPLIIPRLPEGWQLPSYLNIIYNAANIGPVLYGIFRKLFPKVVTEQRVCLGMLFLGSVAAFLMAIFWDTTAIVFGAERSIALFILTFCLSLVDCLSSLVCLPFMIRLKPKYTTSYMMGEGLSGFMPCIFSLIQGIADDRSGCVPAPINSSMHINITNNININSIEQPTLISVDAFFYIMFAMMLMSSTGYLILNFHPIVKPEYACDHISQNGDINSGTVSMSPMEPSKKDGLKPVSKAAPKGTSIYSTQNMIILAKVYIYAIVYGIVYTVQSYSCLPYGNLVYVLSTVLVGLSYPLMAVIYIFFPSRNPRLQYQLIFVGSLVGCYLMATAIMSPNPPLKGSIFGQIIVVAAWALLSCIFGYVAVAISCILRDISHGALFWSGVASQVGGCLGALLIFILVTVLELFHDEKC